MILEIFLPTKLGTKRLLSQRIASFAISDEIVTASKVYATGSKNRIEKITKQILETGSSQDLMQRTASALKKASAALGAFESATVVIPASLVIFKEHRVPFLEEKKIRMVIDYEIEPMLPFSLDEAIIDFVITQQCKQEKSSQILVAAVRKEDIQKILDQYHAADIEPTTLTVDLLALHGLYRQVPEYDAIEQASALIDLSAQTTRVAFLENGVLRLIRNIGKGIKTIAEQIAQESNISSQEAYQKMMQHGFTPTDNSAYNTALKKHVIQLLSDIQFTLNSFSIKLNFIDNIRKLIFTGVGTEIPKSIEFMSTTMHISCEAFDAEKLFSNTRIKTNISLSSQEWHPYLYALAATMPPEQYASFNMRRKEFTLIRKDLAQKQIITALSLIVLIFFSIGLYGYITIANLSKTAALFEKKELTNLKKLFASDHRARKKNSLKAVLKDAEKIVSEKKEMWTPFSQNRLRPLTVMQELTRIIDKKLFDVTIHEVAISADEKGFTQATVSGSFRSRTGEHFDHFSVLQKHFENSKTLILVEEPDSIPTEDGLQFTAKLREKEL